MLNRIEIDERDCRHVVKAVANYRNGRNRIEDTVLTLADHLRNSRRHMVDSLSIGEVAQWKADASMFEELVMQILVAIIIVQESKLDVKYKMAAEAESEARRLAFERFEREKETLVRETEQEWQDFMDWKRGQQKKASSAKTKKEEAK